MRGRILRGLRLGSVYLSQKRSALPSIEPFALLRDEDSQPSTDLKHALAGIIRRGVAGMTETIGEAPVCLGIFLSHIHLVTTRRCLARKLMADGRKASRGSHTS